MDKPRVLSGVKPSGQPTIGNYIGALRQWVQEQDNFECFFPVVDLHAITVQQDPASLRHETREIAALYLAAGIDPEKSAVFVQSHVPAHAELAWILTCYTPIGWLYRMTQYKDKVSKGDGNQESIGSGLLNYPILMAADILIYHAKAVPVGDDQRQHLEITRDLAHRFNHRYGEVFTMPEVMIPKAGARIMGLDDPTKKMSKSEESDYHAVLILDDLNRARKKIMRAVTDSYGEIRFSDEPERAGVNNLLTIYQAFTGKESAEIESYFAGMGYGDLKKAVAEAMIAELQPLQERYRAIVDEPGYLDGILKEGRERAESVANETLRQVKEAVGFVMPR